MQKPETHPKKMSLGAKQPRLKNLVKKLETPMLLMSFVWLLVTIIDLAYGMSPALLWLGNIIWILFILFFFVRLHASPKRVTYLRKNWIFILAVLIPLFRLIPYLQNFAIARILTATVVLQVIWIFASADLGLRSLHRIMGKRGVGYAFALTVIVVLAGAAGMFAFEKDSIDPQGIHSYQQAIWWTSMQITNIGSGYRPETAAGEILCLGISIYSAAMFGYLTAIIATFFIGRDIQDPKSEIVGQKSIQQLQDEIILLRNSIEEVLRHVTSEVNSKAIKL